MKRKSGEKETEEYSNRQSEKERRERRERERERERNLDSVYVTDVQRPALPEEI